eukprot:gene26001-11692_t
MCATGTGLLQDLIPSHATGDVITSQRVRVQKRRHVRARVRVRLVSRKSERRTPSTIIFFQTPVEAKEAHQAAKAKYHVRNQLMDKASKAKQQGDSKAATKFVKKALKEGEAATSTRKVANLKDLLQVDLENGPCVLDLHDMRASDAVDEMVSMMASLSSRSLGKGLTLQVITGRGLHSPDGVALIKESVLARLQEMGQEHKVDRAAGDEESQGMISQIDNAITLTWKQRLIGFGVCMGIGIFFTLLSLPMLWFLKITSFAVLYSLGSIMSISSIMPMSSTCFLMGPINQVKKMMEQQRIFATLTYFTAIILTLVLAFTTGNPILVLLMLIVQIVALFWYCLTWIPGGVTFAKSMIFRSSEG